MRSCQTCTNVEALTIIRYMPLSKRVPKLKEEYASCTSFFLLKNTNSAHHQTTHLLLICDWNALVTHHVALFLYTTSRATSIRGNHSVVISYTVITIYITSSFARFSNTVQRNKLHANTQSTVLNPIYTQAKKINQRSILKEKRILCTIKRTPDTILSTRHPFKIPLLIKYNTYPCLSYSSQLKTHKKKIFHTHNDY